MRRILLRETRTSFLSRLKMKNQDLYFVSIALNTLTYNGTVTQPKSYRFAQPILGEAGQSLKTYKF